MHTDTHTHTHTHTHTDTYVMVEAGLQAVYIQCGARLRARLQYWVLHDLKEH